MPWKYIWQADLKDNAIEDLKKARWYIDREIMKRTTAAGTEMNWQERAEKAEAELAKAMEQRDGLAAKLAELCEQKPVVKYMSRRLTPVGTKEMWGYDLCGWFV